MSQVDSNYFDKKYSTKNPKDYKILNSDDLFWRAIQDRTILTSVDVSRFLNELDKSEQTYKTSKIMAGQFLTST